MNGKIYKINTSSRANLLTIQAFEDAHAGELLPIEAWEIFFENIFEDEIPPQEDWLLAFEMWQKFLNQTRTDDKNKPPTIDIMQDSNLIYDALLSSGITGDEIKNMHFYDMLSRLSEVKDTKFNRVVYLRMKLRGIGGKITKEEQQEIQRIGREVVYIQRRLSREEQEEQDKFERIMSKWGYGWEN